MVLAFYLGACAVYVTWDAGEGRALAMMRCRSVRCGQVHCGQNDGGRIYSGHWAGLGQASGTGRWWKAPVWWIWFRDGQCLRTSTRWRALALRACVRTQDASFSLQSSSSAKLSVQTRSSLSKLRPRAQTGTSSQTSRESQSVADSQRCYPPNAVRWVGEVTSRSEQK